MGRLTPKRQRFVDEYLVDCNAAAAARRAGYAAATANRKGCRLLSNVDIAAAIQERQQAVAERADLPAGWVIERLKGEATADGDDSSPASRVRALELLGKHLVS